MDISYDNISLGDRKVETLFEQYAPQIAAFCRDVARGNYVFNSLQGLRRNLDIMKSFRHDYNKTVSEGVSEPNEELSDFFDAVHILEHGIWAVYASKRLKYVAGNELAKLYLDKSGTIGYESSLDSQTKRKKLSLKFAKEKQGESIDEEGTSDEDSQKRHDSFLDRERISLSGQLDDIISNWSGLLVSTANEVSEHPYFASVTGNGYHRSRDVPFETGLTPFLDDLRPIFSTLVYDIDPRLSLFFEGNEKHKGACKARYFMDNEVTQDELSDWMQTHLKPWNAAQPLERILTEHGDILGGVKEEDSIKKSTDPAIRLLLNLEAAWALMEHVEGIHELIKHDAVSEVYGDDYKKMGREIFFSGAFANYLVGDAINNIHKLKDN